ncbi:hypothetical protein HYT52_05190 [Candidatus Woesearchaeota archaeon]|nr:hypothetical protein [Candidatus Woesearchaeota archaeon]
MRDEYSNQNREGARRLSVRLAEELLESNPEIARLYEPGVTLVQIATSQGLIPDYTFKVAEGALRIVVRSVLGEERAREIAAANVDLGRRSLYAEGRGIFSPEEQEKCSERGKRGGKTAGTLSREKRIGIHGLDLEERSQFSSKGGRASALAKGQVPYTLEEIQDTIAMRENSSYWHQSGRSEGKPNWALIESEINKRYHQGEEVRKGDILKSAVKRYEAKKLEKP